MQVNKSYLTPKEKKNLEMLLIDDEKNKSQIDYIAMMTDVDIPNDEEVEENE